MTTLARLFLALAAAGSLLHADPSLWCTGTAGMAEVSALENGRLMGGLPGRRQPLGEGGGWELRGEVADAPALAEWSPPYAVFRRSEEARKSRPELVGSASLSLGASAGTGPGGAAVPALLAELWPNLSKAPGLLVAGWVVGDRATQVQVHRVGTGEAVPADLHFFLKEEEMGGRPALLLLGGEGFVPPRARFEKPALQVAWNLCLIGHVEQLAVLVEEGLDPRPGDRHGMTLLALCAEAGATRCIPLLLAAARESALQADSGGFTPLHHAARNGREQALLLLLEAVRDAKAVQPAQSGVPSPLSLAAARGHPACVELLLKGNGNVDTELLAPELAAALDAGHRRVASALLGEKPSPTLLASAALRAAFLRCCARGDEESVLLLLRLGLLAASPGLGGEALLVSAPAGSAGLARLLLDAGAPPEVRDAAGAGPLELAVVARNAGFGRELLRSGAKPQARRADGDTLLHLAVRGNMPEMITLLLRAGAPPEMPDARGYSPLSCALLAGNKSCASVLLQGGARLPLESPRVEELIEVSLRLDLASALRSLLNQGWSVSRPLEGGWPLLEVASFQGAAKCEALLRESGAPLPAGQGPRLLTLPDLDRGLVLLQPLQLSDPRPPDEVFLRQTVSVEVIVDATGRPRFIKVGKCPDLRLERAVLEACSAARYEPPVSKGAPTAVRVMQTLHFPSSRDRALGRKPSL
jgi:ankyrin repeat protein